MIRSVGIANVQRNQKVAARDLAPDARAREINLPGYHTGCILYGMLAGDYAHGGWHQWVSLYVGWL